MSFHATAAAVSARPNCISTFRNRLLCSVCTAMLLAGAGGMALAEDPVPPPPAADTAAPTSVPAAPTALSVADAPAPPGEDVTVVEGDSLFGPDESINDITVYGSAGVQGQIRNGTVIYRTGSGWMPGTLTLDGDRAKATGTIVVGPDDGPLLWLRSGATVNEVIVNGTQAKTKDQKRSGGYVAVSGEKSRIETGTVNQGGWMEVGAGSTAGTVTVNNGGELNTEGTADDVTVIGGYAKTAGRINKATVSKDGDTVGVLDVLDKGTIGAVTLNAGGALGVETGGVAEDVTLNGGNAVTTGKIVKATVNKDGKLDVNAGGTAEDVTVRNGGKLEVTNSGTLKDLTVEGVEAWRISDTKNEAGDYPIVGGVGGIAAISGEGSRLDHGTVTLGGYLQVSNKATAGTVTVRNGGWLDVNAGGKAEDVTVQGEKVGVDKDGNEIHVVASAAVSGKESLITKATVNVDGVLTVADEGTVGAVTVNNGGWLNIAPDGKAGDIVLNGGNSTTDTALVYIGGIAGDITLSGNAELYGNGRVGNMLVHAGGQIFPGSNDDKFATLTATGNVTFDKDSFFAVRVANDGLRSGRVKAQGQAILNGGTVKVRAEDIDTTTDKPAILSKEQLERLLLKSFVILEANNGVTGKFAKVEPQANYNYITPSLAYTDKTVSLSFDLTEMAKTEKEQKLNAELKKIQEDADRLNEAQRVANANAETKRIDDAKATELKSQQLAAEQTKAQAEADHLKLQLLEEQVKNLVLVDAVTPNQKSTGHAVMQLGLGNRLLQTVLFSQKGQVLAYDSLSGEAHASLRGTLLQDAGLVSGAASERVRAAFDGVAAKAAPVATPLAYGPEAKDKRYAGEAFDAATPAPAVSTTALWGQAYGGWSHGSSDGNAAAYNRSTGSIVTGVDALIAGTWRLGVLAGYGSTSLHGAGSSVSADSYQLGVYGGTTIDALRLSLGTVLAHHEIDSRRTVAFGTLEETDTAGYSANTVQLFGEAAYRIETPYAALEPFAAAAYTHLKTSGFAETGGIAALSAPSSSTDLTTTTLGLRASRAFTLGHATSLTARGMVGWRHAYGDVTPQAQFAFASGGESFDVSGLPVAADAALVEAGLAFDIGRATTLGFTYTGQFSAGVNDNSVKADLTVRF